MAPRWPDEIRRHGRRRPMRRRDEDQRLPRTRLAFRDLLLEALAGILQRPGRTVLTMIGPILGIGAFVAVMGLTATASGQISATFSTLTATEVRVIDAGPENLDGRAFSFPDDAEARIKRLNGVRSVGTTWTLPGGNPTISASLDPRAPTTTTAVAAVSSGYLETAGTHIDQGSLISPFEERNFLRVAVLGISVARQLGITDATTQPTVIIAGVPFTVIGTVDRCLRDPSLANSVLIPTTTARQIWGAPSSLTRATMLIATDLGAANLIAGQAPLALRPDAPESLNVIPPPPPSPVAGAVTGSLTALFLAVAGVVVAIGAIGIANTTHIAVIERTPEIGLRRALGARPRDITTQFLTESSVLGFMGGMLGTALGALVVVATALALSWTAIMEPLIIAASPVLGGIIGFIAGLYPALNASLIQPIQALRK